MIDRIKIEDLEVFARHGVFPEENKLGQKFLVSAELFVDTRKAGKSDDLASSVDYGKICRFIDSYMKGHTYKLLERVAEGLAEELLLRTPHLERIRIEVKKPWAPVGLPLKTVAVSVDRGWHTAYIALGSNMGDCKAYLDGAVDALDKLPLAKVVKVSSFYETPPYGVTDQPDFLNACLKLRTLLLPAELLSALLEAEQAAGRERVIHWGPRTLDLDLIFFDDLVWEEDDLCIPHMEMHKRRFVLEPLCEIAPYKRHPVYGKTVRELLEELPGGGDSDK